MYYEEVFTIYNGTGIVRENKKGQTPLTHGSTTHHALDAVHAHTEGAGADAIVAQDTRIWECWSAQRTIGIGRNRDFSLTLKGDIQNEQRFGFCGYRAPVTDDDHRLECSSAGATGSAGVTVRLVFPVLLVLRAPDADGCDHRLRSGNLHSAAKAFERAAADRGLERRILVTAAAEDVATADRVVLPGVGAFADCKAGLAALPGMIETMERVVRQRGRPFLGICVGMQLLATRGLEFEVTDGLDWVPGEVRRIEPAVSVPGLKVPHMGWNTLQIACPAPSSDQGGEAPPHAAWRPLLDGIATGPAGQHAY
ncbi:MAG: hypothetical protein HC837_17155, partial [Chloroflexaceae bacterium]|nr:hypothetical protein [Chloroflexaceae bacterium]